MGKRDFADMTGERLAKMIDHTNLKAFAEDGAIRKLCEEAKKYGFRTVCVNGSQIERCRRYLDGSPVQIAVVVGFPLGQMTIESKVFEAEDAIGRGAKEVDYVLNVAELKNGDLDLVEREMRAVTNVCHTGGALCKVIFENCYLTDEEKRAAAEIALRVRPDFIKTSTGFGTGGATVEDVRLMKSVVGDAVKVKAAGGIRAFETAMAMVEAGADRLGTSAGVELMERF